MLALLLLACVRHVPINTSELSNLDGFPETEKPYQLMDRDGEAHPFNAQSQLYLVDDNGKRKGGSFKLIGLDASAFSGELLDGTKVDVELSMVDRLELDVKDLGTPIAMALGLGFALVVVVIAGVMAASAPVQ